MTQQNPSRPDSVLESGGSAVRFVKTADLTWHVQISGAGPTLLLVHGTGASIHSWRKLVPMLASRFTVVVPDLPGHGKSSNECDACLSLPGMSKVLARLLEALAVKPALVVGHSAGAAVLIRMCLDGTIAPAAVVSINGALMPFNGFAGQIFAPLAKLLVLNPFVPRFLAWRAQDRRAVERLLRGTGSELDSEGIDLYAELFRNPEHVAATLGMMANWDLEPLSETIKNLKIPLILVAAEGDKTIAPEDAKDVAALVPAARVVALPDLGHLAHEERPDTVEELILRVAQEHGVIPSL